MPPLYLILSLSAIVFITMKGSRVLMTLYAVDLGAGTFETGIIFALYGLMPFLLAIVAGRVADRFDNRVLIYLGLGAYTACVAIPFFITTKSLLFVIAPLWGLTSLFWVVASQNLVGVLSTAENRTRHYSFYSLGESTGSVIGPIIAGLAIDTLSHRPSFLVMAAFPAFCGLLVLFMRRTLPHTAVKPKVDEPPKRMKDLLALPAMRNALLSNGVVMAGLDLFNLYMPIYGHNLDFSATTIGLIMGTFGAAAFLTRLALPPLTKQHGERAVLAVAFLISGTAFCIFPLTQQPLLLAGAAFLLGLGLGCGQPLSMLLSFNAAPPGRQAEGISMRLAVSYGVHVVMPPLLGVIGIAAGVAPIFWTCAALMGGGTWMNRSRAR